MRTLKKDSPGLSRTARTSDFFSGISPSELDCGSHWSAPSRTGDYTASAPRARLLYPGVTAAGVRAHGLFDLALSAELPAHCFFPGIVDRAYHTARVGRRIFANEDTG